MDRKKFSSCIIEVSKTFCPHCEKPFYEMDGHELSDCPHCGEDLCSIDYDSQTQVTVYVDYQSGEFKMHRGEAVETKEPSHQQVSKEKEELLEVGMLVMVRNDKSKSLRKILWSMPDDVNGQRYCLEGWSFICEKRDIVVPKHDS